MLKPTSVVWMTSVSLVVLSAGMLTAQDYPIKPIRFITGSAGGSSDFIARQIGQGISGPLGQAVVIDNRAGSIFGDVVLNTPPDGYTLFIGTTSLWSIPLLVKSAYDVERDFAPISLLAREVKVLVVHPSLPVKSVKELIALAKTRPGELNYATGGPASASKIAGGLFKNLAAINIVEVPYKGTPQALSGVLSGEVQITFYDPGLVLPHMKSGRLRALAVTGATPSAVVPGLPTVSASGLPGYETTGITSLWAPARTPEAIINRLNREVVRVLNAPDVKERLVKAGEDIVASSPEQLMVAMKIDRDNIRKIFKEAGLNVN